MEINKKNKLISLYKKLNGELYPEGDLFTQILKEVEDIRGSIPAPVDLNPVNGRVDELSGRIFALAQLINTFTDKLGEMGTRVSLLKEKDVGVFKTETLLAFAAIKKELHEIRLLALQRGGGNANRNIVVDSTTVLTPYTDINFKSGTNVTLSTASNNTTKQTDITITASGGGLTKLNATGTINGSNTAFTFTSKPTYIISDGAWYEENAGWTWSGSTATMSVPPQTSIWGF